MANYPRALWNRQLDYPQTAPTPVPGTNTYTDIRPPWQNVLNWQTLFAVVVGVRNHGPNPIDAIRISATLNPGGGQQAEYVDANALPAGQTRWIAFPESVPVAFLRVEASAAAATNADAVIETIVQSV